MKRVVLVVLTCAVSLSLGAWENQDWLTEYSWYLGMDDKGPYVYWHSYQTPYGDIRKFESPSGSTTYRRRLRKEYFDYFYQTKKEHLFLVGYDRDKDGKDDELDFGERGNYSYMYIEDKTGMLLDSGDRIGGQYNPQYPLVGIWDRPENPSEFRLVEPARYVYSLDITRKIPGFAVRAGTYLFKQVGDKVFETDSSFPDGHMRLEIKSPELLVLTPLFMLPDEKGLVEPLFLKRIPRISREEME
jgi:hypothetical protein